MPAIKTTCLLVATSLSLMACSSSVNSNWMADSQNKIATKRLNQLTLPGTHYSNAYGINAKQHLIVCNGETMTESKTNNAKLALLVTPESKFQQKDFLNYLNTQDSDISQQLNNGVRYLELQICLQDARYYTANYYLTAPLATVMQQIMTFIDDNSNEIIIIDLDNNLRAAYGIMDKNDINNLHKLLQLQFTSYLTPKQDAKNLTVAMLWATKQRIILLSSNPDLVKYYDVWDKKQLIAEPASSSYTTIKKLTNIQEFLQSLPLTNAQANLNIIPLYSVFNPDSNSITELHSNPNDRLIMDYLYTLPQNTPLNIVVSDHQYNQQLINFAIQKNLYTVESTEANITSHL